MKRLSKVFTAVQRFLAILRTEKIGQSGGNVFADQHFSGDLQIKVIRKNNNENKELTRI